MEKLTVKQSTQRLNTSRATLYKYLRQCNISTEKKGKKTYISIEQLEKIRKEMKKSKPENKEKIQSSKTLFTLEKKLLEEKKRVHELEKKSDKYLSEIKTLTEKNIEFRTRAEVLDEQNKKIIFQVGAVSEKMARLEMENQKLISLSAPEEKTGKSGIFTRVLSFWK